MLYSVLVRVMKKKRKCVSPKIGRSECQKLSPSPTYVNAMIINEQAMHMQYACIKHVAVAVIIAK